MIRASSILMLVLVAVAPARADADFWAAAREEGTHLVMRHARAPGTGDPPGFRLDDCATQRNLDDRGREQARRTGAAIVQAGVAVEVVLTSAWCRARETAERLELGAVEVEPALNSFFADRSRAAAATAALKRRLAELGGRKAVLVTHQVNVTALTGVFPASGEILVVRLAPDGETVEVRGRLAPD